MRAYPIETYLAKKPAAFDSTEATHRIYNAFRQWAGLEAAFTTDSSSVEVSSLHGENRGYAILVNHSNERVRTLLSASRPVKSATLIGPDGVQLIAELGGWRIELEPWGGAIVEWKL